MTEVVNLRDFPGKGFSRDLPPDVIRVDRRSKWGNPLRIGDPDPNGYPMDRDQVVAWYRGYLEARLKMEPDYLEPLRGKRLACWCHPRRCHADVIAEELEKGS